MPAAEPVAAFEGFFVPRLRWNSGRRATGFAVSPSIRSWRLSCRRPLAAECTGPVALRGPCLPHRRELLAANYLFGSDQSLLLEYFHSYGMVLCFGLTTFALLEGIDRRLIKLSDPQARCAALGLCQRCIKQADVPCGLRRVFLFLIPAMMIVALMPLSAALIPVSYNTTILGTFYNYSHPAMCQIFEKRYRRWPQALFAISLAVLRWA